MPMTAYSSDGTAVQIPTPAEEAEAHGCVDLSAPVRDFIVSLRREAREADEEGNTDNTEIFQTSYFYAGILFEAASSEAVWTRHGEMRESLRRLGRIYRRTVHALSLSTTPASVRVDLSESFLDSVSEVADRFGLEQ